MPPAAERDTAEPMDEDALLQEALAMSMAADEADPQGGTTDAGPSAGPRGDTSMFDAYDEELQNAIKMSMAEVQPGDELENQEGAVSRFPVISACSRHIECVPTATILAACRLGWAACLISAHKNLQRPEHTYHYGTLF